MSHPRAVPLRRLATAAVAVLVSASALIGCSASGGSDDDTFTILQYEGKTSAQYLAWQKAVDIFQEAHPDVTIDFTSTSFDTMQKNGKLLLSGNNVPDVVEVNKGNSDAGQLAAQGLIDPLDDQAAEYGWDQDVTGAMTALARYDEEGKAGSGSWYGVPNIGEFIVWYYNKDMFAQAGIDTPPTTMAELESIMQTFSDEGVTPVASGASGFGALWTWYGLVSAGADRTLIDDFMFLQGDPVLDQGPFAEGTARFADWIGKGYLGSQIAAVTGDQMNAAFLSGASPMIVENSAAFANITTQASFDWGTFLLPEAALNPGSSGHLWAVPAKSGNKDLAYDWIETTLSPEVQNAISENNGLPLVGDPATITEPRAKALNEQFQQVLATDGISFFPDYPVPGLLDFQQSGMQSLVNETTTAQDFVDGMQTFYDEGRARVDG
ncbi:MULTISPECIES: ABC transporter substrate-binding protein [unclassified Rathayibacter]|uniref:ABC transporter substrate-binding protein n=1 Tax=unclassified Rathayibacter TaxID=2609250 RepID=UPI0006FF1E60|nr:MULTISPECIES: extracellular solute-binding protein [unclassified Rathayibacter]KQQ03488.1 hypothetical protein ASF42_08215 [Rathayibacter sp. Leaf294]KQS11944.1 hypothetical protein ASG06_08215 [Rathayibacter sp. Leaf185]